MQGTVPTVPTLGLGVTLELRRTGGGGLTVFTDARRVTRVGPALEIDEIEENGVKGGEYRKKGKKNGRNTH